MNGDPQCAGANMDWNCHQKKNEKAVNVPIRIAGFRARSAKTKC